MSRGEYIAIGAGFVLMGVAIVTMMLRYNPRSTPASAGQNQSSENQIQSNRSDEWRIQRGEQLFEDNCARCHSMDGSDIPAGGPPLDEVYGRQRTLEDGSRTRADEDYIRESITSPRAKIVDGYDNAQIMPSYAYLQEEDLRALITFIKSQQSERSGNAPGQTPGEEEQNSSSTREESD